MPRVNPYITKEEAAKYIAALATLAKSIRRNVTARSTRDRRGKGRLPRGIDQVIALALQLARKYNVELPNALHDDIEDALEAARQAEQVVAAAEAVTDSARDTLIRARETAWRGATTYYSVFKRLAQDDPALEAQMKPMTDFFARRSTAVREDQSLARAEREVENATKKATRAARKARKIKDRRDGIEEEPAPEILLAPANYGSNGANGAHRANGAGKNGTTNG